jgi:hypothetical protein
VSRLVLATTRASIAADPSATIVQDPHFGRHGRVSLPPALAALDEVRADRHGRLVLRAGTVLARLTKNGRGSRRFGHRGRAALPGLDPVTSPVTLDAQDRFVAAGTAGNPIVTTQLGGVGATVGSRRPS